VAVRLKAIEGGVCAPFGFRAGTARCGFRKGDADDLALIVSDAPAAAAGVFTQNRVAAWSVLHNRERVRRGMARAIVCNAGNANAFNGEQGRLADLRLAEVAAEAVGLQSRDEVLTASTGVIGRPFPIELAESALPCAASALERSSEASLRAARAIMTTDLAVKSQAIRVDTPRGAFAVGGIAKGSGMIAPNMATMLAFLTTDAIVDPASLPAMLREIAQASFNRVTVDGDTSTNDLVYLLANGASGVRADWEELVPPFTEACVNLARKIARDGEGATKLIEVVARGDARQIERAGRAVAESPLVKTAMFGNDPNWGRIAMAVGKSGAEFDPERLSVSIGGLLVLKDGRPTCADLSQVSESMKSESVTIEIDLGHSERATARFWTCDFSYDYVRINAEYTT
jgi:glutamate N-acetyltransferase/amino-acid N-acetyltransferase